jgi:hypothetical protein
MFYFFHRGSDYIRCEINQAGNGFVIIVTNPDGRTRTEHVSDSDAAHDRFLELQTAFHADGWWGPHGRD